MSLETPNHFVRSTRMSESNPHAGTSAAGALVASSTRGRKPSPESGCAVAAPVPDHERLLRKMQKALEAARAANVESKEAAARASDALASAQRYASEVQRLVAIRFRARVVEEPPRAPLRAPCRRRTSEPEDETLRWTRHRIAPLATIDRPIVPKRELFRSVA